MNVPLNVAVHCSDGRCGRSTYLVVDPATEKLTHFVVQESWPSRVERQVPVSWISASASDVIVLATTREEFLQLPEFQQTDFIYTDVPHYASDPKLTLLWPHVVPAKRVVDDTYKQLSPGELAVQRGARVRATDGRVGQVDEFLVDPESGDISHLVLREGHPWGQRVVTIPVAEIERIDEKVVYLKLDKEAVGALTSIPVKRPWTRP